MKAETELELFFNELSLHGQFPDLSSFRDSIGCVMRMRGVARRYGLDLRCHRNAVNAEVAPGRGVAAAAQTLGKDDRRALMAWLTTVGPFWDDERRHGGDEYLECRGKVVTDSGIGEAAYSAFHRVECGVISVEPSDWVVAPLPVDWWQDNKATKQVEIRNCWTTKALQAAITEASAAISSWVDLERAASARCLDLTFSPDAFDPLRRTPFHPGVALRLLLRLTTLQQVKTGFDDQGRRTAEANRLYRTEFAGDKARFSDSTEGEKRRFRSELTFAHPRNAGESLFCPWHGKVKTPQLRVHFSWPIKADEPLYVVHVGPKITKR